jgi:steroid delta-isomerase-like uncharacterized protein
MTGNDLDRRALLTIGGMGAVGLLVPSWSLASDQTVNPYAAAYNAHDVDALLSFYSPDVHFEDVPLGVVAKGKAELAKYLKDTFQAFPDVKLEFTFFRGTDTWGCAEWRWFGSGQASDFAGTRANDRPFDLRGATIMEVKDALTSRACDYYDLKAFVDRQ